MFRFEALQNLCASFWRHFLPKNMLVMKVWQDFFYWQIIYHDLPIFLSCLEPSLGTTCHLEVGTWPLIFGLCLLWEALEDTRGHWPQPRYGGQRNTWQRHFGEHSCWIEVNVGIPFLIHFWKIILFWKRTV